MTPFFVVKVYVVDDEHRTPRDDVGSTGEAAAACDVKPTGEAAAASGDTSDTA